MTFWGSIPAKLRAQNDGKGIPLSFHISPISEFYKQFDESSSPLSCKMEKKLEISTLKSVEEFLSILESYEQRITDIRADSSRLMKNMSKKMRNGLKDLERIFSQSSSSFRTEILNILQEVRLESKTVEALVERFGEFVEQLNDPVNKLDRIEDEFTKKLSLIQYLKTKGYTVFGEGDRDVLNDAKISSKDSHLVFFTFRFSPTDEFRDSQEKNIALIETALTDPLIFTTPKLYAVDLDVLVFGDPSPLPVQVHVSYDSVFTTHDMRADYNISVVRIMIKNNPFYVPENDPNSKEQIELLKKILNENKFVQFTGAYPGKRCKFLVSCPNQQCNKQENACQEWCCQECKKTLELAVRSDLYPDCPDTLICSQCKIIALPEKVDFRCCSVATHGLKFFQYGDNHALLKQQIQEIKENCLNVVILGETGVGKSTFINAFANYLQSES